jgi:hypothetical protein
MYVSIFTIRCPYLSITVSQILPYLNESEPVTISIPIPSDSVFTGVQEFRVILSNTEQGMVFLTQQTSITVIDDDGELMAEGSVKIGGRVGEM